MVRRFLCTLLFFGTAHAQQWEQSLASPASLRTGGASLVSSDAVTLDDGKLALITYWEVGTSHDLDVYRCIDVVDSAFAPTSQQCWSWEAAGCPPSGRRPGEEEIVAVRPDGSVVYRYSSIPPSRADGGERVLEAVLYAGEGVSSIHDVPSAGDLAGRLWAEAST
jgi:hypothetical protein